MNEASWGILSTVGNTPLVRLDNLFPALSCEVFAKIERFNPGGSVKDRTALSMLLGRISRGEIVPGRTTVVESSSGNLAIGIAQICRYFDIRFLCVVDARTTGQNIAILRAYGAEVEVVTEPDPATGEYLPARLRRVAALTETLPNAYNANQYANPLNPRAHQRTMAEIADALDGRVDYLVCSTGTTGTMLGCAQHIASAGLDTRIVAVDAVGSAIFGQPPASRLIPGHGASVPPPLLDPTVADEIMHVGDLECVVGCRRLIEREAILAGGSSGAVVAAVERLLPRVPRNATVVMIFPDGGDRYLDTIYSDEWVTAQFGEISHLWKGIPC